MKKSIFALGCALTLIVGTNFSNAQALEQGNIHLDVYAGGPNLYTTIFKELVVSSDVEEDVTVGGLPLLGLRFGYMVSDKISVGLDINYTTTKVEYSDNSFDYEASINRLKAMARFEFHFGNSDQFDFYMPVAAGYKSNSWEYSSTDPNDNTDVDIPNLVPVAVRIGLGGRFYFTDNIGLNLEFGLGGGALIEGGIAIKI